MVTTQRGVPGVYARFTDGGGVRCGAISADGRACCRGVFGAVRPDGAILLGARWRPVGGVYCCHPADLLRAAANPAARRTTIAPSAEAQCPHCGRINRIQRPDAGTVQQREETQP